MGLTWAVSSAVRWEQRMAALMVFRQVAQKVNRMVASKASQKAEHWDKQWVVWKALQRVATKVECWENQWVVP